MKFRDLILWAAALAVAAACSGSDPDPVFEMVDQKTEYEVGADGDIVVIPVKANTSWSARSSSEWITVDPQDAEISGHKETSSSITVEVAANTTYKARSGSVKISVPEMSTSTTVVIKQAAREERSISVKDVDGNVVSELTAPYQGGTATLYLATEADAVSVKSLPSWITATEPAYVEDKGYEVKVTVTANTGARRTGTVTFAGTDVTREPAVSITQVAFTTVTADPVTADYHSARVSARAADQSVYVVYTYATDEIYASYGTPEALMAGSIQRYQGFVSQYGLEAVQSVMGLGSISGDITELSPETGYNVLFYAVSFSGNYIYPSSAPLLVKFTTAAKPASDDAYAALLGKWQINGRKVTVGEDGTSTVGDALSWPLTISEANVNESYKLTFGENDISPIYTDAESGSVYVDDYVLTYSAASKCVSLTLGQTGSLGYTWIFGNEGQYTGCAVMLQGYDSTTLRREEDKVSYGWNSTYDKLVQTSPANPYILATIIVQASSNLGPWSDYILVDSIDKVSASTSVSARKAPADAPVLCGERSLGARRAVRR